MNTADKVLQKCLGGKKLKTDKWSKNSECFVCGKEGDYLQERHGKDVCHSCAKKADKNAAKQTPKSKKSGQAAPHGMGVYDEYGGL